LLAIRHKDRTADSGNQAMVRPPAETVGSTYRGPSGAGPQLRDTEGILQDRLADAAAVEDGRPETVPRTDDRELVRCGPACCHEGSQAQGTGNGTPGSASPPGRPPAPRPRPASRGAVAGLRRGHRARQGWLVAAVALVGLFSCGDGRPAFLPPGAQLRGQAGLRQGVAIAPTPIR